MALAPSQASCKTGVAKSVFETRATKIASCIKSDAIFAIKMPAIHIHSYDRNVAFANSRKHRVISHLDNFIASELKKHFRKQKKPLRIGFDISSINRVMLITILNEIELNAKQGDLVRLRLL